MEKAIIGKKIGMTQIFDEAGRVVPVTLIQAGPCTVVQKKTAEKDGYEAIQLGYQEIPERKLTKPELGHLKKAGEGVLKRHLKEFKLQNSDSLNVGDELTAAVFALAHAAPAGRIHTCLDTSGIAFSAASPERHAALLDECDLVLLDVKHAFDEGHRELTGKAAGNPRALGDELARRGTPVVVRHVVVPGITDDPEELAALGRLIARWDNVVGLDLLPYHTMGVGKYRALGLDYPLEGVPAQERGAIPGLRRQVLEARAAARADRG